MAYYTTTQFAALIGVSPSTLLNWEHRGLFKPNHVTPSGRRYYSHEQYLKFVNKASANEKTGECAKGQEP